jgi:hypothetical protein
MWQQIEQASSAWKFDFAISCLGKHNPDGQPFSLLASKQNTQSSFAAGVIVANDFLRLHTPYLKWTRSRSNQHANGTRGCNLAHERGATHSPAA